MRGFLKKILTLSITLEKFLVLLKILWTDQHHFLKKSSEGIFNHWKNNKNSIIFLLSRDRILMQKDKEE